MLIRIVQGGLAVELIFFSTSISPMWFVLPTTVVLPGNFRWVAVTTRLVNRELPQAVLRPGVFSV